MNLFRISNQDSGHCFGDYEARDEKDALDVMTRDATHYQTYAEFVAVDTCDADDFEHRNDRPLLVTEVDDSNYDNLFADTDARPGKRIYGFRLARFVRAWYPTATGADECSLEDMLAKGNASNGGGDAMHDAIDWLLVLLRNVRDELRAGGELEPTVEQCCEAMARKSAHYNEAFGCQVLVWDDGRRLTDWGSQMTTQTGYLIEYIDADLASLLEGVVTEDGAPDWWDDSWTRFEYWGTRGQTFLTREELPADDPRSQHFQG